VDYRQPEVQQETPGVTASVQGETVVSNPLQPVAPPQNVNLGKEMADAQERQRSRRNKVVPCAFVVDKLGTWP
jgi:hypothetical protein